MSNPSKGKMWADIVMFFAALIPVVLSAICFGVAGLLFVVHDMTPVVERLLTMGAITGGVAVMFAFLGLAQSSEIPVEEDDEDVVDN